MPRPPARLIRLEGLLHQGLAPSLEEICAVLGLSSVRHARRLVGALRKEGLPVQERMDGKRKRFFLAAEDRQAQTAMLSFDEEEMLGLAVAAEAAKEALAETPLGDALGRAFQTLLGQLAPEAYTFEMEAQPMRWHFGSQAVSRVDPQVFQTVQRAVNENRSIRIDYHTASTGGYTEDRKVDPLQLVRSRDSWSVVAWCHLRRGFRDFALTGMERAVLCDPEEEVAYFTAPAGFDPDTFFQDRFGALAGPTVHTVRLLVAADRAPYFLRKQYHPSQRIVKRDGDELEVTYTVAGLDDIRSFVQSWGVGVTVLAPPELVAIVAEEAKVLARRYALKEDGRDA